MKLKVYKPIKHILIVLALGVGVSVSLVGYSWVTHHHTGEVAGISVAAAQAAVSPYFVGEKNVTSALEPITLTIPHQPQDPIISIVSTVTGEIVTSLFSVSRTPATAVLDTDIITLTPKGQAIHAGAYEVRVTDPATHSLLSQQDFSWGVLTFNPNFAEYPLQEPAQLAMAVLDDRGKMVCDADLSVDIQAPNGTKSHLTTKEGTITVSPDCHIFGPTTEPDFFATYQPRENGTYTVIVTAENGHGKRILRDSFRVSDSQDFYLERQAPTRLFPPVVYTSNLILHARKFGTYQIEEHVPLGFTLADTTAQVRQTDTDQVLTWQVTTEPGKTYIQHYTFQAPNISPYLFTLGPATILRSESADSWIEARSWQMASDNACQSNVASGNWSAAGSWTSCGGTTPQASDTVTILNGHTITQDSASVTITSLTINNGGVLTVSSTNAITVSSDWTNNGTFTANSSTVTFSATSSGKNLTGTLSGSSGKFYNLIFNGVSGAWTFNAAVEVANDFTVTNGAVTASNNNLTVTRDFTLANTSGVSYVAGSSTVSMARNFSDSGGKYSYGTSTVTAVGTGSITASNLYNLSCGYTSYTSTVGSFTVFNVMTVNGGTVTSSGGVSIYVGNTSSNTPFVFASPTTLSGSVGLYYVTRAASLTMTISGGNYGSWAVGGYSVSGNNSTFQLGGNFTSNYQFLQYAAVGITGTTFNTQNYSLTAYSYRIGQTTGGTTANWGSSTITLSSDLYVVTNNGSHTINMGSASVSIAGNIKLIDGTGSITLNAGTSTLTHKPGNGVTDTFTTNGQSLYKYKVQGTGSGKVVLSGNLVATSDFTITSGTFDVSATNYSLTVGGNFSNSGTFTAQSGTVTLTPSSTATVSGATTFYNLTVSAGSTVKFEAGTTFRTNGNLNLTGGSSTIINIQSTVAGAQWYINHQGTETLNYSNIQDSGCDGSSTSITTSNYYNINDYGNNGSCWDFKVIISGKVFEQDESTAVTTSPVVRIKVNGAGSYTATPTVSGTFTFSDVTMRSGDVVTYYLDTAGGVSGVMYEKATGIGTLTSVYIYKNRVTINCTWSGCASSPMTSANINSWDNSDDTDIEVSSNGSTITVPSTSILTLRGSYRSAGDVTASGDLDVKAAGTIDTATSDVCLYVAGNVANAGTISVGATCGLTLNGTSGGKTLSGTLNYSSGGPAYITVNGAGGAWSAGSTAMTVQKLILTNGTFTAPSSTLTINTSMSRTSGTYTHNSGTVTFTNSGTATVLSGSFTSTSALYKAVFNGGVSAAQTIADSLEIAASGAASALTISSGVVTFGDANGDTLTVNGQTLIATTSNQTATLQTPSLTHGSTITLNFGPTSGSCGSNCDVVVGATTGSGVGTLKIQKNTATVVWPTGAHANLHAQATGHISITGSSDFSGTVTAAASSTGIETLMCANTVYTSGQHDGKFVRLTSGLAKGRMYPITATTVNNASCSNASHDSITRASTASVTETSLATVTDYGTQKVVRLQTQDSIVTANGEHVGRFLRDITRNTYYRIINSAQVGAGTDTLTIVPWPDDFSAMVGGDSYAVTDGVQSGDSFDVLDLASVYRNGDTACTYDRGVDTANASILVDQGGKTTIQYANICSLGGASYLGMQFAGGDGSNSAQGLMIDSSYLNNIEGISVADYTNNGSSESLGITNSAIMDVSKSGLHPEISLTDSPDFYFAGNYLYKPGVFSLSGTDGLTVADNTFIISGSDAVSGDDVSQAVFSSNTFSDIDSTTLHKAISLASASGDVASGNTISSNTFIRNSVAVEIDDSAGGVMGGNIVTANTFYAATKGVYVKAPLSQVSQNTLQLCLSICVETETSAVSNQPYYIYSNNVTAESGYGIKLTTAPSGTALFNNYVVASAGSPPLYLNSASAARFVSYGNQWDSADNIDVEMGATSASSLLAIATSGSSGTLAIQLDNSGASVFEAAVGGGISQITGQYKIPDDIAETDQDESTFSLNASDQTIADGFTPHGFTVGNGAGSNASSLSLSIPNPYMTPASGYGAGIYRMVCAAANCVTEANSWEVYLDNTLLGAATTAVDYFDSSTGIQFRIEDAGTDYTEGATYMFSVFPGSGDIFSSKEIVMMDDGSKLEVGSGKTFTIDGVTIDSNSASDVTGMTVDGALTAANSDVHLQGNFVGSGQVTFDSSSTLELAPASNAQTWQLGSSGGSYIWELPTTTFSQPGVQSVSYSFASGGTGQIVFDSLSIAGVGASTTLSNSNNRSVEITGNMTIGSNGSVSASGSVPLVVKGDWSNSGTFTPNGGTVIFNGGGGTQTISGASTFANLTLASLVNTTYIFSDGVSDIRTVTGTFTALAPAGITYTLHSSGASKWKFYPQGTNNVSGLSVQLGGCESGSTTIYAYNSIDEGSNDACWVFGGVDATSHTLRAGSGTVRVDGGTVRAK